MSNAAAPTMNLWTLTIIKKHLVGLTGLALVFFLIGHVTGNFLMFVSPQAYNLYGHSIVHNPVYPLIAWGLVAFISLHALLSLYLAFQNRCARPNRYAVTSNGPKKTSIAKRTLPVQGLLFIAFIILHLLTFKYGPLHTVTYDGVEVRDLFTLVSTAFKDPIYVVWYVVCLLVLALHLGHGFASVFQTLGFGHPKYKCAIDMVSKGLAAYISIGFILQPLYMYFIYQG